MRIFRTVWGTFLEYEKSLNPTRREGWRLWSSSWTLVICVSWHSSLSHSSNYFVNANIKRSEPPSPKDSAQLLWVILRANRSSAALFLFLIIDAFEVLSSAKSGNVAGFCVNRNLPYKAISGRIKADCNMRFGCCHNGGRFSPHESEGDFFFEKPSLYAFVKEGDMYERFWDSVSCPYDPRHHYSDHH